MKIASAAVLAAAALTSIPATAQQAPTPVEQRVVVPSLPDEKNKEGVVRPSGEVPTDEYGNIMAAPGVVDPTAAKPTPAATAPSKSAPGTPASGPAPYPAVPTPPPGPTGPADVKAAYLSIQGTVKAYEKGVSITVVEANGRERTVKLAAKASVYEDLAAGDKVVLRIPLKRPADGKSTDRITKQKPPTAQPKSKFKQAQSPAS
jgi:hypothetical protein